MTIDREEILISRVVDGEACSPEWDELEQLARSDPGLWRRLALAQRDHCALSAGVDKALAVCEEIELPKGALVATHSFNIRLKSWSGWATAAAVALVWFTTQGMFPTSNTTTQSAGIDPASWTPEQAFYQYLTRGKQEGRVLSELPDVMVKSQPMPDGKRYEVIILRRVMERAVVDHMYSVGRDDAGNPRIIPTSVSKYSTNSPM